MRRGRLMSGSKVPNDSPSIDACVSPSRAPALRLMLSAAAALGIQDASLAAETAEPGQDAASAQRETRLHYRYSEYDEDAIAGQVIGSAERYFVRAHQFQLERDVGEQARFSLNATQEIMSGSSPWYVLPANNSAGLIQVMSGATIRDTRRELVATLVDNPDAPSRNTYSASASDEDDYRSLSLGYERAHALSPQLTLGYGLSYADDQIDPSDAVENGRIEHADKQSRSAFASLSWVLTRSAVLQAGVQLTDQRGFLSDPYKLVYVDGDIIADARPDQRLQSAALIRYRHALSKLDASLHLDYRFVDDDWSIQSHMIELAWYQSLGRDWRLVPSLRYYRQQAADFYAPFFLDPAGDYASSDYRLSAYGAWSGRLNLRKRFGAWEFSVGAERYRSSSAYGPGSEQRAAPGLVSYSRLYAGFDYGFD